MDEINTGSPNVIDARGQSISREVHNGVAFANFKAHKFSYLNITSIALIMSSMEKSVVPHALTYLHVSRITWLHLMTSTEESYVNCSRLTSTTTQTSLSVTNLSITSVLW